MYLRYYKTISNLNGRDLTNIYKNNEGTLQKG